MEDPETNILFSEQVERDAVYSLRLNVGPDTCQPGAKGQGESRS